MSTPRDDMKRELDDESLDGDKSPDDKTTKQDAAKKKPDVRAVSQGGRGASSSSTTSTAGSEFEPGGPQPRRLRRRHSEASSNEGSGQSTLVPPLEFVTEDASSETDSISEVSEDLSKRLSDLEDNLESNRTNPAPGRRGLKRLWKDLPEHETSLLAFDNEAPTRAPKVKADKEWEAIKQRIIGVANTLGLDHEVSEDNKTISLLHEGIERMSVTRQADNSLKLKSTAPTNPQHLIEVFMATRRKDCKLNGAESPEVAAALYKGLSDKGVKVILSPDVLADLNASPDENHQRIAREYLKKNPQTPRPTGSAPGTPSPAPRQEAQRSQKPQPNPAGSRNRTPVEEPAPESARSQASGNGHYEEPIRTRSDSDRQGPEELDPNAASPRSRGPGRK
jgi:hypothetical protein